MKIFFLKTNVLLRSCDSFKPVIYNHSNEVFDKIQVTCIMGLKINKPFIEALKIDLKGSSEN